MNAAMISEIYALGQGQLESGTPKFSSSKRNALCVALSMFVVQHGKGLFLRQLLRRHCRRAANCSHLLPAMTVTDRYRKKPSAFMFIVHQCSRGVGKAVFSPPIVTQALVSRGD